MSASGPRAIPVQSHDVTHIRCWLRAPWDYLMMALGLLYWGVFGSLLTLIGGPLHLLLPRRIGKRLGRYFLHQLFRKFVVFLRWSDLVRADLSGLDDLQKNSGQSCIVAPNHTSLWDIVFLIARLPSAVCVMKRPILDNPVLGGGARLAGYIANDGMSRMIRAAETSLTAGSQLVLFPEGTRTRPDVRWINPLKGGCAIIAGRAGVPVHPVFIRSSTRFLEKGWPLWRRPVFPIYLRMDVGLPMTVKLGETSQEFTARLEAVFEAELAANHPLRRQIIPRTEEMLGDACRS